MLGGRFAMRCLLLAVAYFVAARVGLTLSFAQASVSPVWPASGIAIAALLLYGRSMWPGIALGALVANATTGATFGGAIGIAIGNTLEAVVAAHILARLFERELRLDRVTHVAALLVAGAIGSAVAATIGCTSLCLAGTAAWRALPNMWWVWWAGDATGILVVSPLLVAWIRQDASGLLARRPLEAVLVFVLVAIATEIGFAGWAGDEAVFRPLAFVPFPLVMWAAVRFGPRGATAASLIVSALAVLGMRDRSATFDVARAQVAILITYQAIVGGTALLLAAASSETRRQSTQYKGLVEGLPDVVARVTRDGLITDLFVPRGLPLARARFVDHRITDALPAHLVSDVSRAIAAALDGGESLTVHMRPILGGRTRDFEARFVASGPDEVTVICRDVTELRAVQAKLLVSERLASVGMLAAGVAHEINNPLTWVMGNIDLARRRTRGGSDAAGLDPLLGDARVGAERIAGIVRDLLSIARPDADDAELFDVRATLDLAAKMATHSIAAHVRVLKGYDEPLYVRGNAARLGQVFLNVIVNAAHAMRDVDGRACELRITASAGAQGSTEIAIEDTGEGIPANVLPRLFEPFFTTKAAGSGTGLGLAICHRIVSAHGGEITIDSTTGVGTTVRISLPAPAAYPSSRTVEREEPVAVATEGPPSTPAPRRHVLVVDDEADIGAMLENFLGDRFRVTLAARGEEALARIREGSNFDAIVCDLVMPQMSGLALYEEVHRTRPEVAARFVFMSGGTPRRDEAAFFRERSLSFVLKPLDVEALEKVLVTMTEHDGAAQTASTG